MESIELFDTPFEAFVPGGILANSSQGIGKAGDIQIDTNNLLITGGTIIGNNSGTVPNISLLDGLQRLSGGFGGDITINASNSIQLDGISINGITPSGIVTTAFGFTSPAGDIDIVTRNLTVQNGAVIDAATLGAGDGGEITINAMDSIIVSGKSQLGETALVAGFIPSAISATSGRIDFPFEATGRAGDLSITTSQLTVKDEAEIAISSISLGEAGNLEIISDSLVLENQGSISAATSFGQGGNIRLQVDDSINLFDESLISAQAGSNANGGNININTKFIIAYPSGNQGSDILASAEQGRGGNIDITAEALLGIEQRQAFNNNGTNDLDASSRFGLDGNISINTPDTNPLRETTEVSSEIVTTEIFSATTACAAKDIDDASGLVIEGKGGVPTEPTEPFNGEEIITEEDVITTENPVGTIHAMQSESFRESPQQENTDNLDRNYIPSHIKPVLHENGEPVYIARGLIVREDGGITLTAYPTPGTPGYREYQEQIGCDVN